MRKISMVNWFSRSRVTFTLVFAYCPILLSENHRLVNVQGTAVAVTVTAWTQEDRTEMEAMSWVSLTSGSSSVSHWARNRHHLWGTIYWDTNSPRWLSQDTINKPSIWLGVTRDWEVRGGGGKWKRNDHWALALWEEEVLTLPSHLSTVKCVGKTFITSMALLRVNSHCNNNHRLRTYIKRAWLALALTLLPPLLGLKQENLVSNAAIQPAVTQAPEMRNFILPHHSRPLSYKTFSSKHWGFSTPLLKWMNGGEAWLYCLLGLKRVETFCINTGLMRECVRARIRQHTIA